jgi:hypothetical protein
MSVLLMASATAVRPQEPPRVARIGWLGGDSSRGTHLQEAFFRGLRDLGYVASDTDHPHCLRRRSRSGCERAGLGTLAPQTVTAVLQRLQEMFAE